MGVVMTDVKKTLWVAIDFDGTLTGHGDQYPECGNPNPYAIDVVKRLRRDGHKIILNTCRRDIPLQHAIDWMVDHDIAPDAVNDNPHARELYSPGDTRPTQKVFADIYIDDRALGVKKTATGSVDFKYIKCNYKKIFNSL